MAAQDATEHIFLVILMNWSLEQEELSIFNVDFTYLPETLAEVLAKH